jgi:transcriptional regulator with XRE-family HTH domain
MAMADEYKIKPGKEHLPQERPVYYSGDLFGDFIRQRRTDLGLSLREVERRTGIGNARLSRWERGEQRPETPDLLTPLAAALDVPVAELCQRAGHDITKGLPHVTPYLHLKYGHHLPSEVLHELVEHCEGVLARHGIHAKETGAA